MYVLESEPRVTLDIQPGAYVLGETSGEGKSYLTEILDKARRAGFNKIISITKSDIDLGFKVQSLIGTEFDVLMLDRYDLYEGAEIADIIKTHPNSYILVDCKHGFGAWQVDRDFFIDDARVKTTQGEIRVEQ